MRFESQACSRMMKKLEVFFVFLRLGITSFGGPIAHLGYFHHEFVIKRKWISERAYADLVALCQFLPGPASSQVGMAIGLNRSGVMGSILAWAGFTLPSAVILVLFAIGTKIVDHGFSVQIVHSFKLVVVAIVAHAVIHMMRNICTDIKRILITLITTLLLIFVKLPHLPIYLLIISGIIGFFAFKENKNIQLDSEFYHNQKVGFFSATLFLGIFFFLPLLHLFLPYDEIKVFEIFYQVGSLVFGGGHVVLPLLESEIVKNGWVSYDDFMSGYALANVMPGPLFAVSAYLGVCMKAFSNIFIAAMIPLLGVFLPAFLLIIGVIPFWDKIRQITGVQKVMMGLNAAVVGLLLAALYDPIWKQGVLSMKDFLFAGLALILLQVFKKPSWMVVLFVVLLNYVTFF